MTTLPLCEDCKKIEMDCPEHPGTIAKMSFISDIYKDKVSVFFNCEKARHGFHAYDKFPYPFAKNLNISQPKKLPWIVKLKRRIRKRNDDQ